MSIPISSRLRACARLVPRGARVADVGADPGYLGLWLLAEGRAEHVCACDLREGPLDSARRNAQKYAVDDRMDFCLSDGLQNVPRGSYDTVVCAGMGGELIVKILSAAPWLADPQYTLILQPQTDADSLRAWLSEHGFYEDCAALAADAGFIYCVLRARFGKTEALSPGQRFVSPALCSSDSPLLEEYISRTVRTLRRIAAGLEKADANPEPERLNYYRSAIAELEEMEKHYADCQ